MTRHEDLKVWKDARELTRRVYRATSVKDFEEDTQLQKEMRLAALGLLTDALDLFEAQTPFAVARSRRVASHSVSRIQSHLYVALDRYYIEEETFDDLNDSAQELKEEIADYFHGRP